MSLKYEVRRFSNITTNRLIYLRYGFYHRISGPSAIWDDGDMFWHKLGHLHRLDGPAGLFGDLRRFFIAGKEYTEKDYYNDPKIRSKSSRI